MLVHTHVCMLGEPTPGAVVKGRFGVPNHALLLTRWETSGHDSWPLCASVPPFVKREDYHYHLPHGIAMKMRVKEASPQHGAGLECPLVFSTSPGLGPGDDRLAGCTLLKQGYALSLGGGWFIFWGGQTSLGRP